MVQHLDRNLHIGGEVKEVYDELVKTVSDDHLRFDLVLNSIHIIINKYKSKYIFCISRIVLFNLHQKN